MDQNLSFGGKSLVPAEYLSLLSEQGQFGVIRCISVHKVSLGYPVHIRFLTTLYILLT